MQKVREVRVWLALGEKPPVSNDKLTVETSSISDEVLIYIDRKSAGAWRMLLSPQGAYSCDRCANSDRGLFDHFALDLVARYFAIPNV